MATRVFKDWPLYKDILHIQKARNGGTYEFKLTLHNVRDELEAISITSIDFRADYKATFSDIVVLRAVFPMGEFMFRFYPWRDMLEASLDIAGIETRWRVILPTEVLKIDQEMYVGVDKNVADEMTGQAIDMQLISLAAEPVKQATMEGVFKGKLDTIIPNIYKEAFGHITVNGKPISTKIEMQEADNKTEFEQLVIPSNTPAIDVVNYIQGEYGIYYRGANRYLTHDKTGKPVWKIFDSFNPQKYYKRVRKIRCFLVPRHVQIPEMHTWMQEDNVFSFVATSPMMDSEESDGRVTNRDIGFTYDTAEKIVTNDIKVDTGIPYGSVDHVSKTVMLTRRPDQLVDKPVKRVLSNKYDIISETIRNFLNNKMIVWHGANITYLLPGDTLNLYTVDPLDKIVELKCSILRTHTMVTKESQSTDDKNMSCTMVLSLAILNRL